MSYSEALSARLVSRWEPVSRNQLLVVLLFFFFLSISEEKCCEKSQPKLSFGRRGDCDLSSSSLEVCHLCFCRLSVLREAATTETNAATPTTRSEQRKRKWNDSISYFFFIFKYFYLWTLTGRVQPGWSENDAAVRLHFNGNKNPDSC